MGTGLPDRYVCCVRNEKIAVAASLAVAFVNWCRASLTHTRKCNFKSTEEATQKVEQTFGCAPVDEDNVFTYCTTSTGSNIICRGMQPPQQRHEKQHELRKQELQEELKYVKERQERLNRKRKALQRQMQLKQQKKRQLWVTQLHKERHEEHRRIRQQLDPCP
jgi:TolA-binding protein